MKLVVVKAMSVDIQRTGKYGMDYEMKFIVKHETSLVNPLNVNAIIMNDHYQ